ncbi:Uncharacterized protein conserved in bacteria [Streptococcus pseudoporcinus]|uniref:Uncharacterized protein conserved in bacteria n=1 Tax=Streptococcus pseudoporcinus TaxID=361101 RepID=A0A4U9XZB6_9STRE|nr:DUF1934 domain-containing protein [Streptococcus pseudoporcinus]VTS18475.1 Uncharacterized protein conserved in bacteria [Streptococcus pseudoporcinus]
MKIEIRNTILIDDQVEKIKEVQNCQLHDKGKHLYFVYQNAEDEKVVIKCNDRSLMINRFSNPHVTMAFEKGATHAFNIPTPLGVQQLITDTADYQFDLKKQKLTISYQLVQAESLAVFADYQLEILWY